MTGAANRLNVLSDWSIPQSSSTVTYKLSNLEQAKQELVRRTAARADLTEGEHWAVLNLGSAILEADFAKLQAMVNSYRDYTEQLARIAFILAHELKSPEVTIFKVAVFPWRAGGHDSVHQICVISLRLENARRFIDIASDSNYGSHVLAPAANLMGKLVVVNEDPRVILRRVGTMTVQGPPPLSAA